MANSVTQSGPAVSRQQAVSEPNPPQSAAASPSYSSSPRTNYFSVEPALRPGYIPWGLTLGGGYYAPIYYDIGYHGYGYWDGFGHWMLWNAMMNNAVMNQSPSYTIVTTVASPPVPGQYTSPALPQTWRESTVYAPYRQPSPFPGMLPILFAVLILTAGVLFMRHHSAAAYAYDSGISPGFETTPPLRRMNTNVRTAPADTGILGRLAPGMCIELTDRQSLQDSIDRGHGSQGIRFMIERVVIATDRQNFGKWTLFTINDQVQPLLLMAKTCDNAIDWRLYYQSTDFAAARREDVIARGDKWLFEAPDDENNVVPGKLTYTAEIDYQVDGNSIRYVRKPQGERQAFCKENPPRDAGGLLATIVEYSSPDQTENPELLVLELDAATAATGKVSLYSGCPISPGEIRVI